jgi:hypothetical protein
VPDAALLSSDGVYRYSLEREWRAGRALWPMADIEDLSLACWIMLNPSTADAMADDPTIRRCRTFSQREGLNGLLVLNLYGLRATDPSELNCGLCDPVGDNDTAILRTLKRPAIKRVFCGWGATPAPNKAARIAAVLSIIRGYGHTPECLGTTADGSPRHPLYVHGDTPFVPFLVGA